MNSYKITLEKFGFPESLIKEYDYWYWLLRPNQVTLGSSILITKYNYEKFSDLKTECFTELKIITTELERVLRESINYKKINYLMLMMNDPVVHYHIIPRYEGEKILLGKKFIDVGYPGLPDLSSNNELTSHEIGSVSNYFTEKI